MKSAKNLSVFLLFFQAMLLACARPARVSVPAASNPTPIYLDMVVSAGEGHVFHQFDQTVFGIELTRQRNSLEFEVNAKAPLNLRIGGLYGRGQDGLPNAPATLHIEISGSSGGMQSADMRLPGNSKNFTGHIALGSLSAGKLTIVIRSELPRHHRIILSELVIRQQINVRKVEGHPPQLLLISVDTLREGALGCFGSPWKTPNLDALAAEGQVWSPSYPGGAWTKPSHATMLTGYRGDTHGILAPEDVLSPRLPTIASRFQQAKIPTAGFVYDCKWLDAKWGFSKGFDEYHVDPYGPRRSWRLVANWAAAHRDTPFFLFFHTFEPHSDFFHLPYESPGTDRATIEAEFGLKNYGCEGEACSSRRMELINDGKLKLMPGELRVMRELYGRGVEETDRALGEFFVSLKAMGLWDNLLIVLTSDHGESFMEHGKLLHGYMWNEVIRVPLIVKWPEELRAGSRGPVSAASIDIAPTLLKAAGLDLGDLPGAPLQTLSVDRPQYVFGGKRAVIDGRWKVIFTGDLTRAFRIYDLAKDPKEQRDLSGTGSEVFARLRKIARDLTQQDWELRDRYKKIKTSTAKLTEEEKEHLRALGYLE